MTLAITFGVNQPNYSRVRGDDVSAEIAAVDSLEVSIGYSDLSHLRY